MPIVYPVTLPATPGTRRVKWSYEFGRGRARSPFTGQSQTYNWAKKLLHVGVEYPPMDRATAEAWVATLRAMDEGSCLFGDPQGQTPRGAAIADVTNFRYIAIARDFLLFDGVDDYVSIPHNAAYNSNALTVELWFKAPSAPPAALQYLATKWDGSGFDREFSLHLDTDGTIHYIVSKTDNTADVDVSSGANLYADGKWHHVAGVKSAGGGLELYVDGVSVGTGALGQEGDQTSHPVRIGNQNSGASANAFAGPICEFRIWGTNRSSSSLNTKLGTWLAGTETFLVGYWRFNDKTGTVLDDLNATNNNGTVSGAAWSGLANTEMLLRQNQSAVAGILLPGDWMQLGSGTTQRLYQTVGSYGAIGGAAANAAKVVHVEFRPGLREIPADQAAMVVQNTQGVFELEEVVIGHEVDVAQKYGISFNLVEAF